METQEFKHPGAVADRPKGLVVGAGPAGLMAAEEMARAGLSVTVAEAKPSPARKLLMAGKSGLNITKDEPPEILIEHYAEAAPSLSPMIAEFAAVDVIAWAEGLGQPVFTGSSSRVFPEAMKASPLLRAWLARLSSLGVALETRRRWLGWNAAGGHRFDTPEGSQVLNPAATVLALGGASWARLGADGEWAKVMTAREIPVAPFLPANAGLNVPWSPYMASHFGTPLKATIFSSGGESVKGEAVLTKTGLEGGAIYALSRSLRAGAPLMLDLAPDLSVEVLAKRLSRTRGKASLSNHLRRATGLPPVKRALLREAGPLPPDATTLARRIKALPVAHSGPRPLDEAISVAGGLSWDALDEDLMIRAQPGTFAAGEMIDWEAPTGGYLITACLATGAHAGRAAARWALASQSGQS